MAGSHFDSYLVRFACGYGGTLSLDWNPTIIGFSEYQRLRAGVDTDIVSLKVVDADGWLRYAEDNACISGFSDFDGGLESQIGHAESANYGFRTFHQVQLLIA